MCQTPTHTLTGVLEDWQARYPRMALDRDIFDHIRQEVAHYTPVHIPTWHLSIVEIELDVWLTSP